MNTTYFKTVEDMGEAAASYPNDLFMKEFSTKLCRCGFSVTGCTVIDREDGEPIERMAVCPVCYNRYRRRIVSSSFVSSSKLLAL